MIKAVVVNHNTSEWVELAMRSLFAFNADVPIELTIYDNGSTDDVAGLRRAAERWSVPIVPSGFGIESVNNSHGEVLRRFVLDPVNADGTHFLFLDADVCFTRPGTVARLAAALTAAPDAFGAGPHMSWDGETITPLEHELAAANPALYESRLHPCCALINNSAVFRRVADLIGLSDAVRRWPDRSQYLDTFELMTSVMRTHGQRHVVIDDLVLHAFGVSYPNEADGLLPEKEARRDAWLDRLRSRQDG